MYAHIQIPIAIGVIVSGLGAAIWFVGAFLQLQGRLKRGDPYATGRFKQEAAKLFSYACTMSAAFIPLFLNKEDLTRIFGSLHVTDLVLIGAAYGYFAHMIGEVVSWQMEPNPEHIPERHANARMSVLMCIVIAVLLTILHFYFSPHALN